jgi:hypothetical protein
MPLQSIFFEGYGSRCDADVIVCAEYRRYRSFSGIVDPRFGLYSAIVVTLVASIFGSSSHLINGPTTRYRWWSSAPSLVSMCASTPLKPVKAAIRCWYTLWETVSQSGPYNLLAVGLGTLLAALLPVRSDQLVQAPANGYAGGTLDMQAVVSRALTFDSA